MNLEQLHKKKLSKFDLVIIDGVKYPSHVIKAYLRATRKIDLFSKINSASQLVISHPNGSLKVNPIVLDETGRAWFGLEKYNAKNSEIGLPNYDKIFKDVKNLIEVEL